jgi:hypothetical protein
MNIKPIIVIFCTIFSVITFSVNAEETENNETITEENNQDNEIDYNKTGIILSLGAFNYFSIGLGFNIGDWKRAGSHFAGSNYGFLIEYKTLKEMHLRIYGNIYGGASATYLGISGILCTNFENFTVGISPEIGLGFPGFSLFYRYNFYINTEYNCHEIVLLIYPVNKIFKRN